MQQISLDEALKLVDGIVYDIDFERDFSKVLVNDRSITGMSTAEIIELIKRLEATGTSINSVLTPISTGRSYLTPEDWEYVDKQFKRERRAEKKWDSTKAKYRRKKTVDKIIRGDLYRL